MESGGNQKNSVEIQRKHVGIHRIQWKSNAFNGNPQNSNGIPWKSGENPWDLMEIYGIQGIQCIFDDIWND